MNDELMKQALRRRQQRADGLKIPDDMEQRVERRLARRRNRRRWWLTAAAAVAAALVLTLWSGGHDEPDRQQVALVTPPAETPQQVAVPDTVGTMPRLAEKERPATAKRCRRPPTKAVEEPSLPDTLGQGIWKSKANVMLALQVLSECERDIERANQMVRNTVIEATFNAMPTPKGCLVVNENGDFKVCEATEENIIL